MSHRRSRQPLAFPILLATVFAACARNEAARTDSAVRDSGGLRADSAVRVSFSAAGETPGMKTPESVRYDADLDVFFVSNINGNPSQKDNNGFIARIDAGNTATMTMFAEGGKNGVTLNAPKGMAIVGDTLWVADIDAVRGFNKRTGAPIATVDLRSQKATFLNDVAAGPDGSVYLTDTGIRFDEKGAMTHPGTDRVFKITGRAASVALSGSTLNAPNGIAWDGTNARFVLAPFDGNAVAAWKPGDSTTTEVFSGPGGYDGVEVLADGRIVVSSWADSALHVFQNGTVSKAVSGVEAPADFGLDTKRNVVALPRFNAGIVQYFRI